MMGGKVAKFGIFSPAVIVAKIVLGEQKLNKVRVRKKEGTETGKEGGVVMEVCEKEGSRCRYSRKKDVVFGFAACMHGCWACWAFLLPCGNRLGAETRRGTYV